MILRRGGFFVIGILLVLAVLGLLVYAGLLVTEAQAHGRYAWISKHQDEDGVNCCGPNDCYEVEIAEIMGNGYAVWNPRNKRLMVIPEWVRKDSEDGKFWLCLKPDDTRRCFFGPPAGV